MEENMKQDISDQLDTAFKSVSDLMSAPYNDYEAFLKKSTIGDMSAFRALLEQELTRVEVSVQELQKALVQKKPTDKELETFGSLYGYIFRISDRLMMLHKELKERMESLNGEFSK